MPADGGKQTYVQRLRRADVAVQLSQAEILGQARDLAGRLGIGMPDVVIGSAPWSAGAVLRLGGSAGAGGAGSAPLLPSGSQPVLTVDPPRLAGLPGEVWPVALAHPLAQLALGQPRRRKRRTTWAALLTAVLAVAAVVALSWPPPAGAWAAAVALAVAVSVLTDLVTIRSFLYEADRKVAEVLGTDKTTAFLRHLQALSPAVPGWAGVAARALPSPAHRASRLGGAAG